MIVEANPKKILPAIENTDQRATAELSQEKTTKTGIPFRSTKGETGANSGHKQGLIATQSGIPKQHPPQAYRAQPVAGGVEYRANGSASRPKDSSALNQVPGDITSPGANTTTKNPTSPADPCPSMFVLDWRRQMIYYCG
jgi:hypothetical protein